MRRMACCVAVGLSVIVGLVPTVALAQTTSPAAPDSIQQRYLKVVESAVAAFEPLWTDDSANIPNSGYFDFRKYDNWEPPWYAPEITVPGNGQVIFCYAVLLTETDKDTFTDKNVPRATLLEHAVKAIRWCCLTSGYVDRPYPFPIPGGYERRIRNGRWVRPIGHRTDVLGWFTIGVAKLWDRLDADTRKLVEQVCIGAAPQERILRTWEYRQGGNHDVVKQDLASTIGAAFLFPRRPDHNLYLDLVRAAGIDLVSTVHDRAGNAVADSRPIRQWASGWNLYPDYSSDHHGWAQVWYGCDLLFEARCYLEILSHLTGIPVPETYTYAGNGFDATVEWAEKLLLPEGEPASVHGMEYDAYYGASLLAHCYAATCNQDPIAAALENQALGLLERHARAVPVYDYHRNSLAKAAAGYLMHKYRGPGPEPIPFADAWQVLNGVQHYRWQQTLIHRSDDRWASFSWGSISRADRPRPCGFIVPTRKLAADLEPLVYFHPESMAGQVTTQQEEGTSPSVPADSLYRYTCSDTGFHTAGVAWNEDVQRYAAAWSFDKGPYVCFTLLRAQRPQRLNWSGLPIYFYARPGMTESRRYHDAEGHTTLEQTLNRRSNWWCVADALGLVAMGGNGQIHVERSDGFNWARTAAYRDKCDGVFVSPVQDARVDTGDVPVELAVALYPDKPFDQIAEVAKVIDQFPLVLPDGWKGLVAPEAPPSGRRFLAVANLFGTEPQATLRLSFPEGAPVLSRETTIVGRTGACTLQLAGLGSFGQPMDLYAEVLDGKTVLGRQESARLYEFQPLGAAQVRLRLHCADKDARAVVIRPLAGENARRVRLRPGERRTVDINLTGLTYVGIEGSAYDDVIGPAVEIRDLAVREDGRVSIEVIAQDRSGLQGVELFCDGQPLGQIAAPPFIWTHRPGDGYHTYQAMAIDAAAQANPRASFKRTILIGQQEGSTAAPATAK